MTVSVRLHPGAIRDLRQAIAWYDSQSPGLGRIVLVELRRLIERLRLFPDAYRQFRPGFRQAALARLPLSVIYSSGPDGIIIYAVPHLSRDPLTFGQGLDDRSAS